MQEFKKELESKTGSLDKAGHEDEGGFGSFGGSSTAQKKTIINEVANSSADSNSMSLKLENARPLWHNKDVMSPLMKKKAQAEEFK